MTIVPIGNLTLQVPESNSTEFMKRLSNQMKGMVLGTWWVEYSKRAWKQR